MGGSIGMAKASPRGRDPRYVLKKGVGLGREKEYTSGQEDLLK